MNRDLAAHTHPTVGFIGIGSMGEPMAAQLAKAGFDLFVYDLREPPVRRLIDIGAARTDSIGALARRCEIIHLAVVDDRQVQTTLRGTDDVEGVFDAARPGTTVLIHSTVHPQTCRDLSAEAATKGIAVLDAPVTGGPGGAAAGTLSIMVGGSHEALARCGFVLQVLGDQVTYMGASGSGQLAKIANNVALAATLIGVHESLALAQQHGIEPDKMLHLLSSGAARSWVSVNWATIGRSVATYEAGGASAVASLTHKDLALALAIGQQAQLPLPGTALTSQLLEGAYRSAEAFASRPDMPLGSD
jgi:3-hydroxyisobutyrate dehydrogenase-like beta-hydroxyacid dehydrogenase